MGDGSEGFLGRFLRLPRRVAAARRRIERVFPEWKPQSVEQQLWQEFNNTWEELE